MIQRLKDEFGLAPQRRWQNRDWGFRRNVKPVLNSAVYIQNAWIEVGLEEIADEGTFVYLESGEWSAVERMKGKVEEITLGVVGVIAPIYSDALKTEDDDDDDVISSMDLQAFICFVFQMILSGTLAFGCETIHTSFLHFCTNSLNERLIRTKDIALNN